MNHMEIPGYRIIREIGKGGMAVVYLAEQEAEGRRVALKVMSPELLAMDRKFGDRFLQEGRTVAGMHHPHIVRVYDLGATEHTYYMAMEYLSGGHLTERIRQGMSEAETLRSLRALTEALDYAHNVGFVHRDIKPENVLFDHQGRTVLTDFGIALAMRSKTRFTLHGMAIGTPEYMSPEQVRGLVVDGRADLYGLGILFHEMLTGRVPYDSEDSFAIGPMHTSHPIPKLPGPLARHQPLLETLMAKNPDDRFPSARALGDFLENYPQNREPFIPPDAIPHHFPDPPPDPVFNPEPPHESRPQPPYRPNPQPRPKPDPGPHFVPPPSPRPVPYLPPPGSASGPSPFARGFLAVLVGALSAVALIGGILGFALM